MNIKFTIFTSLLLQSIIFFANFKIDYDQTHVLWTVSTDKIKITVHSSSIGTKITTTKGTLCQYEHQTKKMHFFTQIYASGIPIKMESLQINDSTTALMWLATIKRYHVLLINQNNPENIEYLDIRSLKPNEQDSDITTKIKHWFRQNPYLNH